jgi:hypothetical protein
MDQVSARGETLKLLFVYNAKAGLLAGIIDSVHKTLSPGTYACDLCAITYGATSMKPEWREWLKRLALPTQFFHLDDFRAAWPDAHFALPAILSERSGKLEALVSPSEFKTVSSVNELIMLLEKKLEYTSV